MTTDASDPFNLARFVRMQARDYATALSELEAGRKRTHWIWYVLPQMKGLGSSQMSQIYGIASFAEAQAYLAHPLLELRLRECLRILNQHEDTPASQILGEVDAMKFRSCLTLFQAADGPDSIFADALKVFFNGAPDRRTLNLLAGQGSDEIE